MIRKGIVINTYNKYSIEREVEYDDTVIEGMYVKDVNKPSKEGANLLFAAFVFPIEHKETIAYLLDQLQKSKDAHDQLVADTFYKVFPKYRG